ncbi:hypothetical protein GCM10009801_64770 [Streptomyces albiaxialis]|uniref:Histidine kinase/HSP90-like ATPase domain-containing protein n=1 Tax=Streptomyces albiaxialis TaxID=329523 RepID=A0ABN2WMV2_9ACTN
MTSEFHEFSMRFSSTPRGARLARRLAAERLHAWGVPYGSEAHDTVTLVLAELCANAIRHGHVSGRDFRLRLGTVPHGAAVRVEVTDTRGERIPERTKDLPPLSEHGRGLALVAALATRWDWHPRTDGGPGKTVWAEVAVPLPGVLGRIPD